MSWRRAATTAAAMAVAIAPVACGSSPEPVYYALGAQPGAPVSTPAALVEVRRPQIAGYLDRERIVRRSAFYRLDVTVGERWGEPLADMIGRVLAEDLAQRLPGSTVLPESADLTAAPDSVVNVVIARFEETADGSVALRAQIAVESGKPMTVLARTFDRQGPRAGTSTARLVESMSGLLGALADETAQMLRDAKR